MSDLMIMLATQQQIANYKVFRQYNPAMVVALSSRHAEKQRWNHGIRIEVCQRCHGDPNAFVELPHDDHGLRVPSLRGAFEELLQPFIESAGVTRVLWNWSGAQKPHSAALLILAHVWRERDTEAKNGRTHTTIYTDWESLVVDDEPGPVPLKAGLTADEVLHVHNLRLREKPVQEADERTFHDYLEGGPRRTASWQPHGFAKEFGILAARYQTEGFVAYEDVVQSVTTSIDDRAVKDIVAHVARQTRPAEMDSFVKSMQDATKKYPRATEMLGGAMRGCGLRLASKATGAPTGKEFEKVARRAVREWHGRVGHQWVADLRFNIEVFHPMWDPKAKTGGEFDCLLIAKNGNFIALDFKSAGKEKNLRGQAASVRLAGGVLARLLYFYPWFDCDVDESNDSPRPAGRLQGDDASTQRIAGIIAMDTELGELGIRFYDDPTKFDAEMRRKLRLS